MSNYKSDSYFVYKKDDELSLFMFAKYNPEYDCFYDFVYKDYYEFDEEELSDAKVGQKVIKKESLCWGILDHLVNDEIVDKILVRESWLNELERLHPDLWPEKVEVPTTHSIIMDHFKNKARGGTKIDPYILGIVEVVSDAMDVRVRQRHEGSFYKQLGLNYPEEVEVVIDVLYDLIVEKLKAKNEIKFLFNNRGVKSLEYKEFAKEVERRSGYSFESKIKNKISSAEYHCGYEDYQRFYKCQPYMVITEQSTVYVDEMPYAGDSCRQLITPENCAEKYDSVINSGTVKVLKDQGNKNS